MVSQKTSAMFQINNAKLYVPVANFSRNCNIRFLENINQGFKKSDNNITKKQYFRLAD